MKRWVSILLIMTLMFCGCFVPSAQDTIDAETSVEEQNTLWIVTSSGTMYSLIKRVTEQFGEEHEGLTINLEKLPLDAEEREAYMERLRVQIMAGNGPDIYLLPLEFVGSDQLFNDVTQSKMNGLFLDISEYYDADEELNKDGLVTEIMNAGVLNGSRYVLPLRYNYPVAYVDVQRVEAACLNVDGVDNCLMGITEIVQTMGGSSLTAYYGSTYFAVYWPCFLPELFDYDNQKVALTKTQLEDFLTQYRNLMCAIGDNALCDAIPDFGNYISNGSWWALDGQSVQLGSLDNLIYNLRIAKAEGIELAVIPLKNTNEELVASITFYGAIGASCENPKMAYALLREFLLEENQWENNLSENLTGLIADGWPVLTDGAWSDLNADLWLQIADNRYTDAEKKERKNSLKFAELTEKDYSVLDTEIDIVQFPVAEKVDYWEIVDSQLNAVRNTDVMNVDVGELAENLIWELEWHLAEG